MGLLTRPACALVLMTAVAGCKKAPPPPPQARVEISAAQQARIDELVARVTKNAKTQDEERRARARRV